jgi:hypothetical protein
VSGCMWVVSLVKEWTLYSSDVKQILKYSIIA